MSKFRKKKSHRPGLPPGTLIQVGEKPVEQVRLTLIDYDEYHLTELTSQDFEACVPFRDKPTVTWIHVDGVHRIETLQSLGNCFQLHPLTLEDILTSDQRTKIEHHEDYIFIVLKNLFYHEAKGEVATEQVSLIVGRKYVISFHERQESIFEPIAQRLRSNKARIRKMGADYLAYALLDMIVDNYFTVLDKLGDRIEILEEDLVRNPTPEILHTLHAFRREMIVLRKAVWPLREVINALGRADSTLISESMNLFLRDVYDHTIQVIDTIEIFRDVLTGMLDVYLSSVSNRLNAVMKILTILSTIFMPLTFIAGVYGMNFRYMPELEWPWGYPMAWAVMLFTAVLMLGFFKLKKWL